MNQSLPQSSSCCSETSSCCGGSSKAVQESQGVVTRPRTDIFETDTAYLLRADMPGIDEATAEVSVEKNVVTISGRVEPYAPEGFELVHQESEPRHYERRFRLTEAFDPTGLKATVSRGVLSVTIPKAIEAQKVRVTVQPE